MEQELRPYYSEGPYRVRSIEVTDIIVEKRKAIELVATTSTESAMYLCPICKFGQFKTEKEYHKMSCSGLLKT